MASRSAGWATRGDLARDMTYVERPPMAAMLHALEIRPSAGYLLGQHVPAYETWCRS